MSQCFDLEVSLTSMGDGIISTRPPDGIRISITSASGKRSLAVSIGSSGTPVGSEIPNIIPGNDSATCPRRSGVATTTHSTDSSAMYPWTLKVERWSEPTETTTICLGEFFQCLSTLRASSSDETLFITNCLYLEFRSGRAFGKAAQVGLYPRAIQAAAILCQRFTALVCPIRKPFRAYPAPSYLPANPVAGGL